jgi:hypothetical protein
VEWEGAIKKNERLIKSFEFIRTKQNKQLTGLNFGIKITGINLQRTTNGGRAIS